MPDPIASGRSETSHRLAQAQLVDTPSRSLAQGGEMETRIRDFDWSATPLGPIESWSPALRTMVRFLLANRFPLLLWWGPQYVSIYNDPYRPVLGTKHPWALGRPVSECWQEIWDVLRPLIDTPYHGGPATWNDDILLEINRYGFLEETHFTIAYSPVPDETVPSGIGGVLATVHEITEKVIGERRILALRDLAARLVETKSTEETCAATAETLSQYDKDVPFVLIYLVEGDENRARLAGASGIIPGQDISPLTVNLDHKTRNGWPLAKVKGDGVMQVVHQLKNRFAYVPSGPWADPPNTAAVVPVFSGKDHRVSALLLTAVSSRLRWDEAYGGFLELVSTQLGSAIANARAYEEERKRAEALAELDRAKTTFFSNVSHEFRTPLTLILAPLQDALAEINEPRQRERLELLQRNAFRLQKLVNSLLDFSRIEAGRIRACFEPTDLTALTRELASVFRSAIEKAGMRLIVDCQPINEPIYVDREMYEKIVLNLMSNAFKFTLEGEIEVGLAELDQVVELSIKDTGAGMTEEQLPHLFERFHRIEGVRARTHEGTGIGLALVQELVKLHGGTIRIQSAPGQGSIFTVTIPKGRAHIPADQIGAARGLASTALGPDHYVQEALRWLGEEITSPIGPASSLLSAEPPILPSAGSRPKIVWADDNADMRDYVRKLLSPRIEVQAFSDGQKALAAVQRDHPDLVLADIMMPHLDGFSLTKAIRADPNTRSIPVILLSARAGDEARVEGLEAGADDYLVKPFTARELVGLVEAHLKLSLQRRQTEEALREGDRRKDEFLAILAHELRNPLAPILTALQMIRTPDLDRKTVEQLHGIMDRQSHLLVRLVDDLMEVSRITRGRIELRKQQVELETLVQRAVETSRPLIDAAHHQFTVRLPNERLTIEGDPVRLAQALSNLLNNSAKYTEEFGHIWLTAKRENSNLVLSVRDNGIGIPADMLPRVFNLFTQVRRSYSRAQGGLGIGLALVRSLVEMHGGKVEAKSAGPGLGSEFIIRLPLARTAAGTQDRTRPVDPVTVPACRILVVDDNRDSAESFSMFLKSLGAEVWTVNDGQAALEALKSINPSVLFLDIGMPGIDGYELARRIREQQEYRDMTLIAFSGWGHEEDRLRSREAGINHHLVKPVDPESVRRLLATLPC